MKRTPLQRNDLNLLGIFVSQHVIGQIRQAMDDNRRVEKVETEIGDNGSDYTAIDIDGKEVCRVNGY